MRSAHRMFVGSLLWKIEWGQSKKKKEEKLKLVVVQLDGSLIFEILANEHGIGRNAVF